MKPILGAPDHTTDLLTALLDIERYSDRFRMGRASADGTLTATLASLAESRKLDRSLLPSTAAEAIFDKKKRGRAGAVGKFHNASTQSGSPSPIARRGGLKP